MLDNYTIYHLHSDYSNATTNIDSVTKPEEYIKRAKEFGMKSIAFSEHGNVFNWVEKKMLADKYEMKYIHGVELYVTETLDEKKRDNYHIGLYAKNYEGVLEINELVSIANRKDGHFYYNPRITFDELINTSNNIIIVTACIGGILSKGTETIKDKFKKFLIENNDRCFLEVQHHDEDLQREYNKYLAKLSKESNVPLIAGTDTHALDENHAIGRKILQTSKRVSFKDEGSWNIVMMNIGELINSYLVQDALSEEDIREAISNTNKLSDMVEDFGLNTDFKYPKLFEDSLSVLNDGISHGILTKGIDKYSNFDSEYLPRISYELEVFKKQGAIDYLLLDKDIKDYAKKSNIYHGPARGSASGSLVAYLIGLTEIDPIKENLIFERFMNADRVTLADIDSDWPPTTREKVKEYVLTKEGLYCSEVITFNTVALKGSIRDCARALEMPLEIVNEICKNIETNEEFYRRNYPQLFEYVDIVNGTIVSAGINPCGCVVSPIPLDTNIGTCALSSSEHPVSSLSKTFIEKLNFVKLDVLGLDNIEIINNACELAGIPRLTPDNVKDDEKVWKSIRNDTVGIFQWESPSASKYIEKLFSDGTIERIKKIYPDFRYIDLFSVGNGAIRPAGASYRDLLAEGIFRDNGHEALNRMLAPTLGYLVYQEQIIEFLNKFCSFTMSEADIVRRAFAKKIGTDEYIPRIKAGFIKTMKEKYNVEQEEAEKIIVNFIEVIIDASNYLFSLNHSQVYSYIGYICGYLREHYPLEFFTALLNRVDGNLEKVSDIMEYLKKKDINILPPTYGKSKSEYFFDKKENLIYKGVKSIKYLNGEIAEILYNISQTEKYDNFVDLYINTPSLSKKQWEILIKVGYFRNFGSINYLLKIIDLFTNTFKNKTCKKENLNDKQIEILRMFSGKETDKQFSDINKVDLVKYVSSFVNKNEECHTLMAKYQLEFMGSTIVTNKNIDKNIYIVTDINTKYTPTLKIYRVNDGEMLEVKVYKNFYSEKPLEDFDIIYVASINKKNKKRKDEFGRWVTIQDEFNYNITYYKM